jgi:G3E family GTPase
VTERIPCFVITGALGAGKTTVIRALMERSEMAGTVLIVNEFGEVGLDHLLVSSAVETTLLMENGCMCCSLRGDIVDTVLALFGAVERGEMPAFKRIIVETTGLADPIPILRDLTHTEILQDKVKPSGLLTCVDGVIAMTELRSNPVAVSQVAQADVCFITKTDLADPLGLDDLHSALTAINPIMRIVRVRDGDLPPFDAIFDDTAVHLPQPTRRPAGHGHAHAVPHGGVESWSVVLDRPYPWAAIRDWLDLVYSLQAARMLRMKGLIWIKESPSPLLVQGVGPIVSPLRILDEWPGGKMETRLVLIARELPVAALRQSFAEFVLTCPTRSP